MSGAAEEMKNKAKLSLTWFELGLWLSCHPPELKKGHLGFASAIYSPNVDPQNMREI